MQHVKTLLEINGPATVVMPDNALFEGGASAILPSPHVLTLEIVEDLKTALAQCEQQSMGKLPHNK